MRFINVAAALFATSAIAGPCAPGGSTTSPGNTGNNPGGNNPGGNNPGGNNPGGNNPGGNNPGGNNPGGNNPGGNNPGNYNPCPGALYSQAQCCATDVLGVLDLDCKTPAHGFNSKDGFDATCAETGAQAKCCAIPVAGQDVLCSAPAPGGNNPGGNNPGGNNPGGNNPGGNNPGGNYNPCPGSLYSQAECCATDVLGVADLDCKVPAHGFSSKDGFDATCAESGAQAKCCAIPVAGQSLLCTAPAPGGDNGNNPGGNNPGGNNPGGNNPGGNNPGGNNPGGNNPGNNGNNPSANACPGGLYSQAQCCATDVLGVADLDCKSAPSYSDVKDFGAKCAATGAQAKCCVVPVAGQSLLCADPVGL